MKAKSVIGQTLDGKYKIERELGRGGMGTVYLATHVGTERPVAVKVIVPQFMERAEFVERFRREARAAGRLRHPNVVDVTDFGIADTSEGRVAYLVMEYLDGCTLGEVLEEEQKLPVSWTIDILEQVCSAVQEAHAQGIIHRDLKPDNIWLEPNQRGGYTVKVLDFGIAKLEESMAKEAQTATLLALPTVPTRNVAQTTAADLTQPNTMIESRGSSTVLSEAATAAQTDGINAIDTEAGTLVQANNGEESEDKTAILPTSENKTVSRDEKSGTKLVSAPFATDKSIASSTADLTRVGAVLGTPLYMSPEQCRGERLSPSSDIYSLGVIAYQMLSGNTPFTGDFKTVMQAHREIEPPRLDAKKVPRKVKKVISSALSKNIAERPLTAEAFASQLRSQSEGIWTLLRRSLVIYSEHLPKFLGLTTFLYLPVILLTIALIVLSFLRISDIISSGTGGWLIAITSFTLSVVSAFCAYLIIGTTTWIVAQYLAVPLRPVRVRPAFAAARKKWKTFAGTGIISTILTFVIGVATCGIGFLVTSVLWTLLAPVVMMENLRGWKALKRSTALVRRSLATTVAAVLILFLFPAIFSGSIYFVVNVTAKAIEKSTVVEQTKNEADTPPVPAENKDEKDINVSFGTGKGFTINNTEKDMQTRVKDTILESIIQIFWLPMHIFVTSFSAIIIALLYLKTRQAGGESMNELIEQFEETESPQSNWQRRVRDRLIQSGRIQTGRS